VADQLSQHSAISLQGLHPSNMFACAVDFLLRLKPTAVVPLAGQYAALSAPAPLKIGIHIRVGDQQLVRVGKFDSSLQCVGR
jgi:hypothetical protein